MALPDPNPVRDINKQVDEGDIQQFRQCTRRILDSVAGRASSGDILLDNVSYRLVGSDDGSNTPPELNFFLGLSGNPTQLLDQWIAEQSSNIAFIPPEEVLGTGDKSKVDSWALGCLLIQQLQCGKPLELMRHQRSSSSIEYFVLKEPDIHHRLRQFYTGIENDPDLVVGPKVTVHSVPYAVEDFLARCLDPIPAERWTMEALSVHPFADLTISLEELIAKEKEYYRTLPLAGDIAVNNPRVHPCVPDHESARCKIFVGESPNVTRKLPSGKSVEVWTFDMHDEARDRERLAKAYAKLLDLFTPEQSDEQKAAYRTGLHRIRALQQGYQNIVHHYGCKFEPQPDPITPPKFVIFTEHCAGENFKSASSYHLPITVILKWVEETLHGLDFLHKHGIAHLTMNSTAIFFTDARFCGTVKIGGFHDRRQLSRSVSATHDNTTRKGVDECFAAPEIRLMNDERDIGSECDIWSIGLIVLQLVTGQAPEMAGVQQTTQKVSAAVPVWVPGSIRKIIEKCLQLAPADRPTAAALLPLVEEPVDEALVVSYKSRRPGYFLPSEVVPYWTQRTNPNRPRKVFGRTCTYHYEAKDLIGSGGYGIVYKAKITNHGDYTGDDAVHVAVKAIKPNCGSDVFAKPDSNKWQKLLELKHDNLVAHHKVTIILEPNGILVELMMDYCPGGDLHNHMIKVKTDGPLLKAATALQHSLEIAEGVKFLHDNKIVHSDLKPQNILIMEDLKDNKKKMLIGDYEDFIQLQRSVTGPNDIAFLRGTYRYMSPEMMKTFIAMVPTEQPPGRKTDIWSVGCILLEIADCITGNNDKRLHNNEHIKEVDGEMKDSRFMQLVIDGYAPLVAETPEVPVGLRTGIRQCLISDSRTRISAADLVQKLREERNNYRTIEKHYEPGSPGRKRPKHS